jgi:hypothetical protein
MRLPLALAIALALWVIHPTIAHADNDPCSSEAPGCPVFGHWVCRQLALGIPPAMVAAEVQSAYDTSKTLAAALVAGAEVKYCDSYGN